MESFSVRNGFASTTLVMGEIPKQARTRLYNFFHDSIPSREYNRSFDEYEFLSFLWSELFFWSKNDIPDYPNAFYREFERFLINSDWNIIYDKIEKYLLFLTRLCSGQNIDPKNHFNESLDRLKRILKEERLGYQILEIDGTFRFIPLSNSLEVSEVEIALQTKNKFIVAQDHIKKAISAFSQKPQADYTNTIKESISAVESVCRDETGKTTLGEALKVLRNNNLINTQLAEGIDKIYAYTNNPVDGIRHSKLSKEAENSTANYDEAKFFLVFCSTLVNYLTSKFNVAEVKHQPAS